MILLGCILFNFDCGEQQERRGKSQMTQVFTVTELGKRPWLNSAPMRRGAPNSRV